jgi:sugar lactone lactonase YvrE
MSYRMTPGLAQTTVSTYSVSTLAGSVPIGDGAPAAASILRWPGPLVFDNAGNLYISDSGNASIRKVTPDGFITTVAGTGVPGFSGDGGSAGQAQLSADLVALVLDAGGNLYIADSGNNRIRMISAADGSINTIVDGTTLPLPETQFGFTGLALDNTGNLYIADGGQSQLYRIAPDGTFTVIAGTGSYADTGDGGPATQAALKFPWGLYVDASGAIYVSDPDANRIRIITPDGMINTFAGTGKAGFAGDAGPAVAALLDAPYNMVQDTAGDIYFLDAGNLRVRRIGADGTISTVAGSGTFLSGNWGDGGPALQAQFGELNGLVLSAVGDLYISDWDSAIRVVTAADGIIQTAYGQRHFTSDGALAANSLFFSPTAFTRDGQGNFYISDEFRVRKIDATGVLSTIAGIDVAGNTGDGGPANVASLYRSEALTLDASGNLYIGSHNTVRRVDTNGMVTTVAGGGGPALGDGGPATAASLSSPIYGLAVDASGSLYIADSGNRRIRKVSTKGIITVVAGTGTTGDTGDGGLATAAKISAPVGLVFDKAGNFYFADNGANRVRKISPAGIISTFAGTGTPGAAGDGGPAVAAQIKYPWGLAIDAAGNIYIADNGGYSIRVVTTDGMIHTIASGNPVDLYSAGSFGGDGGSAIGADYNGIPALTVDSSGNVYLLDSGNERIRVLTPNQP